MLKRTPHTRAGKAAAAAAGLALVAGCAGGTSQASTSDQLVWSTYNVGTGTYNDVAAVANALTTNEGIQVRLMAAESGIGRLAPLISGIADYARAGDEYYYAFEGDYEYASPEWGPQDIRIIWAPLGHYGFVVAEDSGIETFEDLEGRKVPRLTANTSINLKSEGFLDYAGLTWDDVTPVAMSYGEQPAALESGQLDVMYHSINGPALEELNSSKKLRWLSLDGTEPERFARWGEFMPMVEIAEVSHAAGQIDGESAQVLEYTIPVTTLASRDDDEVYDLVGKIADNFDSYSGATPDVWQFSPDEVLSGPIVVPFHEGSVRYLKEHDMWTEEDQRRNDALIERGEQLQAGWAEVVDAGPEDELPARWAAWKAENLTPIDEMEAAG